jgi:hypothetical protein
MSLTFAYSALLGGVLVWLFLVRKLSTKSWEPQTTVAIDLEAEEERTPAKKIGLWVFLCVVTALFGLFISAYYMRMGHGHGADGPHGDWASISKSPILWFNSLLLVLSSIVMQWSRSAVGVFFARQSRRRILLCTDRRAWLAFARRAIRLGSNLCAPALRACRSDRCSSQRRAVLGVLAFHAVCLGCAIWFVTRNLRNLRQQFRVQNSGKFR